MTPLYCLICLWLVRNLQLTWIGWALLVVGLVMAIWWHGTLMGRIELGPGFHHSDRMIPKPPTSKSS